MATIRMPNTNEILGFKMFCRTDTQDNPSIYHVAGSNDTTNDDEKSFTSLYYSSGETYDELGQVKRIFNNPTAYKYYRIVILDIYAPSTSIINHSCAIQELMFLESDETQHVSITQFNDLYQQNNALINLLNTWIINGALPVSALTYTVDPIRENM